MKTLSNIVATCGLAAALGLTLASQGLAQDGYYYYRGHYPYRWSYPAGPVGPGYVWPGYAYGGDMAYAYAPRPWFDRRDRSTLSPGSLDYAPSIDK